jgi:phasin family protein
MAQSNNPFGFDPSQMFNVDPQQMMEQWQKSLEAFNVPGVDMSALVDSQRKNVEAVTAANRIALEGIQALMQRQGEILQQSFEEATRLIQDFDPATDPAERMAHQTELAQEAFQHALANMRELAEMASSSQAEALEAIQARFNESLEEIKAKVTAAAK